MADNGNIPSPLEGQAAAKSPATPASDGKAPVAERSSEDDGNSTGKASGRGRKRAGLTAGGAGASQRELEEMPSARQKRILANRQSAARSKERKLAYISELEAQVSTLTVQLTTASLQLRSLQQDTASLGECNAALSQQAIVLREHMAQRDAETASLAAELRRAQGILAAHNLQEAGGGSGTASGGSGATDTQPPPLALSQPTEKKPGSTESIGGDAQQRPPAQMGRLQQWTQAQAQQQGQLSQQQVPSSEVSLVTQPEQQPQTSPMPQQQARGDQQQQPRTREGSVSQGQDNANGDLLRQLQATYPTPTTGTDRMSGLPPTVAESGGGSGSSMATDAAAPASSNMEQLVSGYTAAARARAAGWPQAHGNGSGSGGIAFGSGNSSFSGYKGNNE